MKKSFAAWVKNLFKGAENEQEKRMNAELTYREQERAFRRYDADLDKSIAKFKAMAIESYKNNQQDNALRAAQFVKRMSAIKEKVASVQQHFEMMHVLSTVSDVMVKFMDNCNALGCDLREQINLRELTGSQAGMEDALEKLNFITECVEQAFKQIENSFTDLDNANSAALEEDRAFLNEIVKEADETASPLPVSTARAIPVETANKGIAAEAADEKERDHFNKEMNSRLEVIQ